MYYIKEHKKGEIDIPTRPKFQKGAHLCSVQGHNYKITKLLDREQ